MAKKRISYRMNESSISITFNSTGWTPLDTKLLEHFIRRVNAGDIPPSEPIAKGLALYSMARHDCVKEHFQFIKMLDEAIKYDASCE